MNAIANHPCGITDKPSRSADKEYRYQRFTTMLLFRDMRFRKGGVAPGDAIPDFSIATTDGDELTKQDVLGEKPLLLIFGSVTCPMTASAMPFLKRLHSEFGDRADFILLNVREAHPGEHFPQPATMDEKLGHARALKELYEVPWTVAADNIEGSLHRGLDPKPNSVYLVNKDGVVVFRSLWASDQKAVRQALKSTVSGRTLDKSQSQALIVPVARAMGHVHEVMDRAGPQAVRDLWRAGLPMALAGRIATVFSPLSPDQRGVAAVLTLALSMLLVMGSMVAWFLD